MALRYYTRLEIIERVGVEADFLVTLEREAIVSVDAPAEAAGEFSPRMFERIRVADNLIHDLDVNIAGAGIIVRMRETLLGHQLKLEELLLQLQGGLDGEADEAPEGSE